MATWPTEPNGMASAAPKKPVKQFIAVRLSLLLNIFEPYYWISLNTLIFQVQWDSQSGASVASFHRNQILLWDAVGFIEKAAHALPTSINCLSRKGTRACTVQQLVMNRGSCCLNAFWPKDGEVGEHGCGTKILARDTNINSSWGDALVFQRTFLIRVINMIKLMNRSYNNYIYILYTHIYLNVYI